jgi:hypothetical protein
MSRGDQAIDNRWLSGGITMRSELVFKALAHESNRYQLVRLVAKGIRKLHRPNTRVQDTANEVLEHFIITVPRGESGMFEQHLEREKIAA